MLSQDKIKAYTRRLLEARMRILNNHGFFGLLLMSIGYGLDETMETAATDGEQIKFAPSFMDELSDGELDFVMMHEILHLALQHCFRGTEYDPLLFNIACDIVVNSNILKENGMNKASITLKKYGESMHLTPSGKEGYNYTAEEVYEMLLKSGKRRSNASGGNSASGGSNASNGENGKSGKSKSGVAGSTIGKGSLRGNGGSKDDGDWDDHSKWKSKQDTDNSLSDIWAKKVQDAATAITIINSSKGRGTLPMGVDRLLKELREGSIDWRTVLNNFVQDEICDYSFSPPDRRFDGTGFFLPDFNEKDEKAEDILFMIDTSGSMSDKDIANAYAEIKGAIDQFNGKLVGWLGFFDASVVKPIPFMNEEEFRLIRPKGGGGTRFDIIFDYVKKEMSDRLPKSIVILTDGYAPFPDESDAMDIPVLWIINNESVEVPFGRVARIKK